MKPTIQITGTNGRASFFSAARAARSLQIDANFQDGDFPGRGYGDPCPRFRRLGEEYFQREARSQFAIEAAFFGLIVLTAALPVFESIQGLVRFVYGAL